MCPGRFHCNAQWYSTYGNHDYGQYNRACACLNPGDDTPGEQCAQVQKHGAKHNNQEWYMPAMSYYAVCISEAPTMHPIITQSLPNDADPSALHAIVKRLPTRVLCWR